MTVTAESPLIVPARMMDVETEVTLIEPAATPEKLIAMGLSALTELVRVSEASSGQ